MGAQFSWVLASLADAVEEPLAAQKLSPLDGGSQRGAAVTVGHLLPLLDPNLGDHLLAQVLPVHQGLGV